MYMYLEMVGKYFHFVRKLLEGTVYITIGIADIPCFADILELSYHLKLEDVQHRINIIILSLH